MWQVLRNRGVQNLKFRRQFKIGDYVVDFCCIDKKLIVELDGGHHGEDKYQAMDLERQTFLENAGYKVLRFWNNDVDGNIDGIIQTIIHNS